MLKTFKFNFFLYILCLFRVIETIVFHLARGYTRKNLIFIQNNAMQFYQILGLTDC